MARRTWDAGACGDGRWRGRGEARTADEAGERALRRNTASVRLLPRHPLATRT